MGQLKNRLILIAMMLALPLAGLVFFGLLTEHNFNTLPYFTKDGEMEGRTLAAQRVGAFEFTNQNGERFSSESPNLLACELRAYIFSYVRMSSMRPAMRLHGIG